MKKDIFIDNNRTQFFSNPTDDGYKKLIEWLRTYSENEDEDAYGKSPAGRNH